MAVSDKQRLIGQVKANPPLWEIVSSGVSEQALLTYDLDWLLDHVAVCRSILEELPDDEPLQSGDALTEENSAGD